jgi:hypothetical protein
VLPFLDLVAYLIRVNLGYDQIGQRKRIDINTFKFVLFVSYPSPSMAIARDLCLGLQHIVQTKKLDNFEYVERFSNGP